LSKKSGNAFDESQAEIELAFLYEHTKQIDKATTHYQRAIELVERVRKSLGYEEFQLSFFRNFQPNYDKFIQFFLRQNRLELAFETSEQLRSRILLALLGNTQLKLNKWIASQRTELDEILNLYGENVLRHIFGDGLRGKSRGVTVDFEENSGNEPQTSKVINAARHEFIQLAAKQLNPTEMDESQFSPITGFKDLQPLLGEDDALLSYLVTNESIIVFIATDQSCHFQHLAYPSEKLKADVDTCCNYMSALQDQVLSPLLAEEWFSRDPQSPRPQVIQETMDQLDGILGKLFSVLVAPVLPAISGKNHWVIVPHGSLHLIPWSALRWGDDYLIQHHSISLLPSVSVGSALAQKNGHIGPKAVFVADPNPKNDKLQLPASQKEVNDSYRIFGTGVKPLIGARATKQNILKLIPEAGLLHFACHHVFDPKAPMLSFLKLSGERGKDLLYAFEITELKIQAELVSLSACQSGRSHIGSGDEQYGIVRAFLLAGAKSVISTLWSIEDESAAIFFSDFYNLASQEGLAQALANAQRRLITNPLYELPCFWAPYTLSGLWKGVLTLVRTS
jgi:hypothetical protein